MSGSPFAEEKLFVPERGSVLHVLSKDEFMVWEGPRTALCSDQRVFALKHTAILRIEMLKRVHDAKGRVSITGYGVSRTEPAIDSGFQCN